MRHRRRTSPLQTAGAGVAALWCAALGTVAVVYDHPLVLAAVLALALAAARAAGVLRTIGRATAWAVPFGLVWALLNPILAHEGVTVWVRLGAVPVLGDLDVTREELVYGGVLGLRAVAVVAVCALYSACVNPDALLALWRRRSPHAALTAALATRLVPTLARDAARLHEAQRGRPGGGAGRIAVARAVTANVLDRAVDVAATLELRGFGLGGRPPRTRVARSRHDRAFAAGAGALLVVAVAGAAGGWDAFTPYPRTLLGMGAGPLAALALLAAGVLAPFADRRGLR